MRKGALPAYHSAGIASPARDQPEYGNHMRIAASIIFCSLSLTLAQQRPASAPGVPEPWSAADVLSPEEFARQLAIKQAPQPQIFNVGFAALHRSKHIPGALYAGPGSKDAGLEELKKAVAGFQKDRPIVLYCGCCPWDQCPNMKPAFKLLAGMGFTQVKVMKIPTNFAKDWVDKGFPVESSAPGSTVAK